MTQRVVSEMFQFKCIDFLLEDVFFSKSSSMGANLPLEVIFRWSLSIIGVYLQLVVIHWSFDITPSGIPYTVTLFG